MSSLDFNFVLYDQGTGLVMATTKCDWAAEKIQHHHAGIGKFLFVGPQEFDGVLLFNRPNLIESSEEKFDPLELRRRNLIQIRTWALESVADTVSIFVKHSRPAYPFVGADIAVTEAIGLGIIDTYVDDARTIVAKHTLDKNQSLLNALRYYNIAEMAAVDICKLMSEEEIEIVLDRVYRSDMNSWCL